MGYIKSQARENMFSLAWLFIYPIIEAPYFFANRFRKKSVKSASSFS